MSFELCGLPKGFDHAEIGQHQGGRLRLHRAAAIGMQCQLIGGHGMFCYGVEKQRLELAGTFGVFDPPACDAAAIDVESDIPPTFRPATAETPLVRRLLIGIAVAGLALLVFAPLLAVFAEALAQGWTAAVQSLGNRDAWSAIKLTLLIAGISIPMNAAFGIAAAWFITKFDFRSKAVLITLIDLPFSVSPVVAGLCIVLMSGTNSLFGGWLVAQGHPKVFALPGITRATMFVTFRFVARELIPIMIEQGRAEEEAALTLGAGGGGYSGRSHCPTSAGRCCMAFCYVTHGP